MHRILHALIVLLLLVAPADAQSTKAQLNTEVTTNYPDNTTGAITPAILRTTTNDLIASFQQITRVNSQTGVSYTFTVGDNGFLVTFNNGGATAVTLPQATTTFATWNAFATNLGAGAVTITPTTSTINGAATYVLNQGQSVFIVSDGTNYQVIATGLNASQFSAGANINITGGATPTIATKAPISATTYTNHGVLLGQAGANIVASAAMTNGQLLVGQTGADPSPQTVSQDGTLSSAGVLNVTRTGNVPFTSYATAAVGQLPGTTTNDSATAGNIGEFISSTVLVGSAVGLTNNTDANVTSISLTAGDWDVAVDSYFTGTGTTTVSFVAGSATTTSATRDTSPGRFCQLSYNTGTTIFAGGGAVSCVVGPTKFSLSGTTTVFFTGTCAFGASTCSSFGIIRARRVR